MNQFIREEEYAETLPRILEELGEIKATEVITSFDGCQLYCERYLRPESRANLVIVHGFTEFSAKYSEMIWHFLRAGFNVFIYDQRGHGFSGREVENLHLAHVNRFEDYVEDLHAVISRQVVPYGGGLPVYLFSHSMGGAVAALYLMEHRETVQKAILSSPMVCPQSHRIPRRLVLAAVGRFARRDGWTARFPYMAEFDPDADFASAPDASYARFRANLDARILNPEYQTSAATNSWMREALRVQDKLLNPKRAAAVEANVLLVSAGQDTVVKNRPQRRLARRLKHCRLVTLPEAKHTIFSADAPALKEYYQLLFEFLEEK